MATFVYRVLALVSIGPGAHGDVVPHISITVSFVLVVVDLAVLIYFIWPAGAAAQVAQHLRRTHVTGPYRTLAQDVSFGIDQLLLDQAAMIRRSNVATVAEEADRAGVERRYEALLAPHGDHHRVPLGAERP